MRHTHNERSRREPEPEPVDDFEVLVKAQIGELADMIERKHAEMPTCVNQNCVGCEARRRTLKALRFLSQ